MTSYLPNFRQSPYGNEPLREAFFQPQKLLSKGGIEPIIAGLLRQRSQKVDPAMVEDLRSFLFTEEVGSAGLDLAAFNIQRGRDHGLPNYTRMRQTMGLHGSIESVISSSDLSKLMYIYNGDLDLIDPWLGALLERPAHQAMVGELLQRVIGEQFNHLRLGDRYWYDQILKDPNHYGDMGIGYWSILHGVGLPLEDCRDVTLADIIQANTDLRLDFSPTSKFNAFYGL